MGALPHPADFAQSALAAGFADERYAGAGQSAGMASSPLAGMVPLADASHWTARLPPHPAGGDMGAEAPCNFFAVKSVLNLEKSSGTLITDFSKNKEIILYERIHQYRWSAFGST